jgi:RNA polymerase sigma factor (sigma-70 family)
MAMTPITNLAQHLRQAVLTRDGVELTDGQLLEDYVSRRNEAALAALVCRHGPMVWGVCRRILRDHHDAEDAFQATFLVLVRRAASVVPREMVSNWLFGVAHQTALKARSTAAKRGRRETQVSPMPEPAQPEPDGAPDLRPLLDQEVSRLPTKYRAVLVLCDLEGKPRKEVAQQLACPEGTVGGRLARAREMLAKRLLRHGVTLSAGGLAAALSQNAASAGVPAALADATINAAYLVAAGQSPAGVISANVAALTEGVLRTMLLSRLKTAMMVLLLAIGLVGVGVLGRAALAGGRPDDPAPKAGAKPAKPDTLTLPGVVLTGVDGDKKTIVATAGAQGLKLAVANDAKVTADRKAVKLTDLKAGKSVTLELAIRDNWFVVVAISTGAAGKEATSGTLTVKDAVLKQYLEVDDRVLIHATAGTHNLAFPVAKDAKITDGKKEVKPADLKAGTTITLRLAARKNEITVVGIATGDRGKEP